MTAQGRISKAKHGSRDVRCYLTWQRISFQVNSASTIWNPFFPKLIFCQVQRSKNNRPFRLPGKLLYCHCIIGCVPIEVVSRRNHLSSNYICQSTVRRGRWLKTGARVLMHDCVDCSSLPFVLRPLYNPQEDVCRGKNGSLKSTRKLSVMRLFKQCCFYHRMTKIWGLFNHLEF